jgi:hypothetical protein
MHIMSERWKCQIKSGGLWGILMVMFFTLSELNKTSLTQQIENPKFWLRSLIYLASGIFILGYFNWKAKVKSETNKK